MSRALLIALLYIAGIAVLFAGGWRAATSRNTYGAGYFGAALLALGFTLPAIVAGFA